MQCGAGNTALIVYALAHLPERHHASCRNMLNRAFDFLLRDLDHSGFVRGSGAVVDYPLDATALTLAALNRIHPHSHREAASRMAAFLCQTQVLQNDTNSPSHRDHGGWSPTAGIDPPLLSFGRTNLATTSRALTALTSNRDSPRPDFDAALSFIERCHSPAKDAPDAGGYFFSPHPDDPLNKAGTSDEGTPRPYGTAVIDGARALIACGGVDDPRLRDALHWLEAHSSVRAVPGFEDEQTESWGAALWHYYAASLAELSRQVDSPHLRQQARQFAEILRARQSPSGWWSNPQPDMREDDPLIATAFALIALSGRATPNAHEAAAP
jgi:hypothetical protein